MGNSLRCCLACVLPCGALDLIRIVHLNGYVEEITRPLTAGEVLKSYPNHVLSKPCSQGMVRKILILSPDSDLKRGSIYFLIPDSSLPNDHSTKNRKITSKKCPAKVNNAVDLVHDHIVSKSKEELSCNDNNNNVVDHGDDNNKYISVDLASIDLSALEHGNIVSCDGKIKSKSKSGRHQRRRSSRGKSGVWHPHLASITEDL